ncbi:MAG: hypothetical protein HY926_07180 [Elusimicrobia bacterium]|nr:hypothetical protein [Elusimicrobiota bacterium]
MKNAIIAVILLAVPAGAAPLSAPKEASANIAVAFKLKNALREASGRFVVGSGNQANYVVGGELTQTIKNSQGKGIEYKKHGVIINCLPALAGDGKRVRAECQFEISGPGRKNADLDAWDVDTFQYQTSFTAELGKAIVLVDEPDRRVEVTLSLAP